MRISVALCTYNGDRFLEGQLTSILSQSRPPDEIIVRDDCSQDRTVAIVKQIAANSAVPMRLTVNPRNLGSTKNFEAAIVDCTGDLIALADQDDVWVSHKLATMARAFEEEPELGGLFSDLNIVDESLRPLGVGMFDLCQFDKVKQSRLASDSSFDLVLSSSFVTGAALMFRADLRRHIIPMPADTTYMIHDRWIAIVIAATAKLRSTNEKLVLYRQHTAQQVGADIRQRSAVQRMIRLGSSIIRPRKAVVSFGISQNMPTHLSALRAALDHNIGTAMRAGFLQSLDDQILHFLVRGQLPKRRRQRIIPIIRELSSGRYIRFSKGFISAARDFMSR